MTVLEKYKCLMQSFALFRKVILIIMRNYACKVFIWGIASKEFTKILKGHIKIIYSAYYNLNGLNSWKENSLKCWLAEHASSKECINRSELLELYLRFYGQWQFNNFIMFGI